MKNNNYYIGEVVLDLENNSFVTIVEIFEHDVLVIDFNRKPFKEYKLEYKYIKKINNIKLKILSKIYLVCKWCNKRVWST